MSALASNSPRTYEHGHDRKANELPVVASGIIYEGSAVGLSSQNARALVALDSFAGFATDKVDNSAGAAGDKRVVLKQSGTVKLAVVGASATTVPGTIVYALSDNDFTLTSTGATAMGKWARWEAGTTGMVNFEGVGGRAV